MRLLLDTHALLWWMSADSRLGQDAIDLIADPTMDVLVSVASLWEIVVKTRVGKLEADVAMIEREISRDGFTRLAIEQSHLVTLATLPIHHRDPFDHLLIAQAISEGAALVSDDQAVRAYPVQVVRPAAS